MRGPTRRRHWAALTLRDGESRLGDRRWHRPRPAMTTGHWLGPEWQRRGCITIYVKPYRALVRYIDAAIEFHPGQRVGVGRCLWAQSTKGRIAQAPGALGKPAA